MVAGEGFEPSQTESESVVLPLHNPASWCERRDLNPYGLPHAPQTCASAGSATLAFIGLTSKPADIIIPAFEAVVKDKFSYPEIFFNSSAEIYSKLNLGLYLIFYS